MVGGPAWVQLLGGSPGPLARPWRPYSKSGIEVCTVAYFEEGVRLDRPELLGVSVDSHPRRRLLRTFPDVREEANRLCKKHPELRADVRCRSWGPFEKMLTPEEALCP